MHECDARIPDRQMPYRCSKVRHILTHADIYLVDCVVLIPISYCIVQYGTIRDMCVVIYDLYLTIMSVGLSAFFKHRLRLRLTFDLLS